MVLNRQRQMNTTLARVSYSALSEADAGCEYGSEGISPKGGWGEDKMAFRASYPSPSYV